VTDQAVLQFGLAVLRAATPLAFCALGVLLAERAGVLNIAVEGMMLCGSLAAVLTAVLTQNAWLGVVAAVVVGAVTGLVLGALVVLLPADQVVSGIAFNITAQGLTSFIYKITVIRGVQLIGPATLISLAGPAARGNFLASISPLTYVALVLTCLAWVFLFRTGPGLLWRSLGESARASHASGMNVRRARMAVLVLSGVLCALGGASLTLAWVRSFTDNITMGRGFIALAAVYFGRWNPLLAVLSCLLFGAGEALAFRAQALGSGINPFYYLMLPYVLTLLAVGLMGRAVGPKEAGKPYLGG